MKILALSHPKPDWMFDYLLQGAIKNGAETILYPKRKFYFQDKIKEDSHALLQVRAGVSHVGFTAAILMLIRGKFDLVLINSKGVDLNGRTFVSSFVRIIKAINRNELGWLWFLIFGYRGFVVVDGGDEERLNKALLRSKKLITYYKRELSFEDAKLAKLRPIRFGINVERYVELLKLGDDGQVKKYDICYIMNSNNHPIRKEAKKRLEALKSKYAIYIHDSGENGKISLQDYAKITRQSRITLSISGLGWDCLRHYEIPALGSVLMCNAPNIHLEDFFVDGKEAIFFSNDLADFEDKLKLHLQGEEKYLEVIQRAGYEAVRGRFDVTILARKVLAMQENRGW